MQNAIELTKHHFESSYAKTQQYLNWFKLFKKEFTEFLNESNISEIQIGKPNHFNMYGFFKTKHNLIFYFSISDIRTSKNKMLIRIAEDFKDFSGGSNNFIPLNDVETFTKDFNNIVY